MREHEAHSGLQAQATHVVEYNEGHWVTDNPPLMPQVIMCHGRLKAAQSCALLEHDNNNNSSIHSRGGEPFSVFTTAAAAQDAMPMLSAPHCSMSVSYLKVEELVCYFLASFSDVQLFGLQHWSIHSLETKHVTDRAPLCKQPASQAHVLRKEIPSACAAAAGVECELLKPDPLQLPWKEVLILRAEILCRRDCLGPWAEQPAAKRGASLAKCVEQGTLKADELEYNERTAAPWHRLLAADAVKAAAPSSNQ